MPAKFLKQQLDFKPGVTNVVIINEFMLKFSLKSREYVVYMPMSSEYLVGSDVIAKAIDKGADLVVCEPWCQVTGEAYTSATNNGEVKVYPIGNFLSKITKSEDI